MRTDHKLTAWGLRLALALCAGCSGASLLLKSPVQKACEEAGLQGCPDVADGVLLYIDGNKEEGKKKLVSGAADNSPEDVQKFAAALRQLENIPGVSAYTAKVVEVAKILDKQSGGGSGDDSGDEEKPKKRGKSKGDDSGDDSAPAEKPEKSKPAPPAPPGRAVITADTDPSRFKSGMVKPSGDSKKSCNAPNATGSASCVKAVKGPLVVTDIHASQSCMPDLFVYAGAIDGEPTWLLGGAALAVHGARLLVGEGEGLIIGVRQASDGCSVLWSGFKPYKRSDAAPAAASAE